MDTSMQFNMSSFRQLVDLGVQFADEHRKTGTLRYHDAAESVAAVFGITDFDAFAQNALHDSAAKGFGFFMGEGDAAAVANVMKEMYRPVVKIFFELLQDKDARGLTSAIAKLNDSCAFQTDLLRCTIQQALPLPDALSRPLADKAARKTAEAVGPYAFSLACFTAAFMIYRAAARDAQLAREARLEAEKLTARALARMKETRAEMESLARSYLLDRLVPFAAGMEAMDRAALDGDDDAFIMANADVQAIFAYEMQYTSAEEFEDLMCSDRTFKL